MAFTAHASRFRKLLRGLRPLWAMDDNAVVGKFFWEFKKRLVAWELELRLFP
ncbi:MAG: hypothetical protein H0A75_04085 [Candidatus Methanofishera endochildressiae]|uniref:Uncharacterized protein n=1 Tax=Candidatus Methanofishera endochildressiae TaxID=2738884 RepID=A0A7Z0MNX4_9GAMM|nr:hypothetical protein [Candidatus Methanofishera endochildressiae]